MITIVIPFCNEGSQVAETIHSIYQHSSVRPEIIVINDASDDNYDYGGTLPSSIRYVTNEVRQGIAASRDIGVNLATNKTVLLLDAHMRIYDDGFDEMLEKLVTEMPDTIFCSNASVLNLIDGKLVDKGRANCFGARLSCRLFDEFKPVWNQSIKVPEELKSNSVLQDIPVILGAAYAFNKDFYQRIGGLYGLKGFGYDEALLSVKAFMLGSGCKLISNWYTGHIYRKQFPYAVDESMYASNLFVCYYLFLTDETFISYLDTYRNNYPENSIEALNVFQEQLTKLFEIKEYLNQNMVKSFRDFLDFNRKFNYCHGSSSDIIL